VGVLILNADARAIPLPDRSVQCVITSPPYWGLRDYRHARQIGLEAAPVAYVATICAVFEEVYRVLCDDGTVWLNLGDTYARTGGTDRQPSPTAQTRNSKHTIEMRGDRTQRRPKGIKDKDLIGIPWLVAFALRDAGWYLRADIIWAKAHEFCADAVGSTMPLGGKKADRPTSAHEYLFLLTKSSRYYYDEEAIKQVGVFAAGTRAAKGSGTREGNRRRPSNKQDGTRKRGYVGFNDRYFSPPNEGYAVYSGKRRLRDVWFITPQPYKDAHFATFPLKLVEPCMLAGSRAGDLVLDPFGGSGTVGVVASMLGRQAVLLDTKFEYCQLAQQRNNGRREIIHPDPGLDGQWPA